MSRISGISGGAAAGGRPAKAAAPGGFTVVGSTTVATTVQAPAVQAALPAGLAGMLALQEAQAETVENRNGKRHGLAILAALQALQRSLLGAGDPAEQIASLVSLSERTPAVIDTGLGDVLTAIRLRAKIELHRRGQ